MIKGAAKIKDEEWLNLDSDGAKDRDAAAASSLPAIPEETSDVSVGEGRGAGPDEIMEEVRADPKHWPLKLPGIVAARMAGQSEEA